MAGNFDAMWGGYFELCLIMMGVGNLYTNLESYPKFSFVMAEVGNLYAKLEGYFKYFS